jgi:hypothetical protein
MHEFVDDLKRLGPSPLGRAGHDEFDVPGAVAVENT